MHALAFVVREPGQPRAIHVCLTVPEAIYHSKRQLETFGDLVQELVIEAHDAASAIDQDLRFPYGGPLLRLSSGHIEWAVAERRRA